MNDNTTINQVPSQTSQIPEQLSQISQQYVAPESSTPSTKRNTPLLNTSVTLLLLVFLYPLGWILMIFWTHWPKWLKIILTLPSIYLAIIYSSFFSRFQQDRIYNDSMNNCVRQCQMTSECWKTCRNTVPTPNPY